MKYAPLGSISHATLRTQDLLDSFEWTLRHLAKNNIAAPDNDKVVSDEAAQEHLKLCGEAQALLKPQCPQCHGTGHQEEIVDGSNWCLKCDGDGFLDPDDWDEDDEETASMLVNEELFDDRNGNELWARLVQRGRLVTDL